MGNHFNEWKLKTIRYLFIKIAKNFTSELLIKILLLSRWIIILDRSYYRCKYIIFSIDYSFFMNVNIFRETHPVNTYQKCLMDWEFGWNSNHQQFIAMGLYLKDTAKSIFIVYIWVALMHLTLYLLITIPEGSAKSMIDLEARHSPC